MVPQGSDPPGKRIRVTFKPGSPVPFKDRRHRRAGLVSLSYQLTARMKMPARVFNAFRRVQVDSRWLAFRPWKL